MIEWVLYALMYILATYGLYRSIRYWRLNMDPELQSGGDQ